MRRTKELQLDEVRVTVKEVTLSEIRAWLFEAETKQDRAFDPIGDLLFEDCRLDELLWFCDATMEIIDSMPPSDVRLLIDAAKELNPDFFSLRAMLQRLATSFADANSSATSVL